MAGSDDIRVAEEHVDQPEVRALLEASDAFHSALYPAESNHLVGVDDLDGVEMVFLVARINERIVGCGAIRDHPEGYGELKRMWVNPAVRGHGVGTQLLAALENAGRARGHTILRLETGIRQPEALRLYRAAGYLDCAPFGSYRPDPLSVFMEKRL
jgi:putative acetyltransferase